MHIFLAGKAKVILGGKSENLTLSKNSDLICWSNTDENDKKSLFA